ncbi:MAG: glycosyltransferase [Pigmentiphaga sp.]
MTDPTAPEAPSEPTIPPFSALLSLYQGERAEYFEQCLQSIAEQSWPAAEVVLVLDGPVGDELAAVLERWRGRLPLVVTALPTNQGLGLALAHGLTLCRHDLVVRVDTDDVSQPWRFERQIDFMEHNPQLAVCGSCMWEIDPETQEPLGRKTVPETDGAIRAMLPYRNPFNHPTVVLRREAVLAAGSYQDFPLAEDYHLWLPLLAGGGQGWNLQDDLVLARTGSDMLRRRRGWPYVRTEYRLYRTKRQLRLSNPVTAFVVFILRTIPRLLPLPLLRPLYRLLRSNR